MSALSGSAYLRPVRLGFVASHPSRETIRDAVRLASGVWGGMYCPILDAEDREVARLAEALALDVLHPLDDADSTKALTDEAGYRWRGGAEWGPFGGSDDAAVREGLLPIDRLVGPVPAASWVLRWADDDVGALCDVLFGCSASPVEAPAVSPPLSEVLGEGDAVSGSPIARTTAYIEYLGAAPGVVVVLLGDDPADLVRLWNLRAAGGVVYPWVVGHQDASAIALQKWLNNDSVTAHAGRARRGDGTDIGLLVNISAGQHEGPAEVVRQTVEQLGFTAAVGQPGLWGGWRGHHPLSTPFERPFNLEVSRDAWHVDIPLPALPLVGESSHWPGTVAADIVVHRETESATGRTVSLPALRPLATPIDQLTRDVEQFHRPTGEGRVVAVQAAASAVTVALIPTMQVFATMLPGEPTVGQSDDGRFATHFIDRLGGVNSVAASQPAVRQVLYDLSNADRSSPIPKLIDSARHARGAWPDLLARQAPRDYARSVVYGLLDTGLVVPTTSVRCPKCATETDVRPEDLATEMRCAVCRSDLNLGLALAVQGPQNPWRYRLAAHLPPARIRSGLAVMATNAVLRRAHRAGFAPAMPHVFGLTLKLDEWNCEIDLAALIMDGPLTLAVVGEVKGGRDQIDATDVGNLQRVQQLLRTAGIETFVMVGTTRRQLEAAEVALLRVACESAPPRLMPHYLGLALPIVLCGPDLSLPWFDDGHPWRWGSAGDAPLAGLGEVSCRRNLGLSEGAPTWRPAEQRWAFSWSAEAE